MRTYVDRRRGKTPPDPELVNKVLDMMEMGMPNNLITEETGVSRTTMYRWRAEAIAKGEARKA